MTASELVPEPPSHRPPLDRRTVLRGAAALGGVAVVAACGGSSDTPADSAGTSDTPTGSGTSPSGSGGGGGGGTVVGPAADVAVGSGKVYDDPQVVVTQPTKGEFKAFSSICTHAGCPVATVTDTINCDCHGSMFSIDDGSVVGGPAPQPLPPKQVKVDGSDLVVS